MQTFSLTLGKLRRRIAVATLFTSLLLAMSVSSYAWNGPTQVTEVNMSDAGILVKFSAFTWYDCGSQSFFYVGSTTPTPEEKIKYQLLLIGLMSNKTVFVNTGGCIGGREVVQFVAIYP